MGHVAQRAPVSWPLVVPPWLGARLIEIFGSLEEAQAWYGHKITVAGSWQETQETPCAREAAQGEQALTTEP